MRSADIERDIQSFIIDNFLYGRSVELTPDESLLELGLIDSTGVLELVTFLESQYAIQIYDEEVVPNNFDSLHKLVEFVAGKLRACEVSICK